MKHLFTSLLFFAGLQISKAQLTQANHALAIGDSYSTYQCGDTLTISLMGSGSGVNWDYSSVPTRSSIVKNYTVSAPSNPNFPSANVLSSSGSSNNFYYNSSASNLLYNGGNVNAGAVSGEFIYSSPAVTAIYPMSLNSNTTSSISGSLNMTVPLTLSGTFTGSALVVLDASGTLTLPGPASFNNVMRVITSQTIDFVTSIASGTVYQVNYEYFDSGVKGPLFSISTTTAVTPLGTFPQTVITRQAIETITVSLPQILLNDYDISVFPNPVKENLNVNIKTSENLSLSIYNLQGQLLSVEFLEAGNNTINTENLLKGLYFYTVLDTGGRVLKRDKLLKE